MKQDRDLTALQILAQTAVGVRAEIGPAGEDFNDFFDRLYTTRKAVDAVAQILIQAGRGLAGPKALDELAGQTALINYWAVRWGDFGFNTFELTPSLAAGLMLTSPAVEEVSTLEELRLPFPSFAIKLPDGVIPVFADDGNRRGWGRLLQVCVYSVPGHGLWFRYVLTERDSVEGDPLSVWCQGVLDSFPRKAASTQIRIFDNDHPYVEQDDITHDAVWRLVRNFCSWLSTTPGEKALADRPRPTKAARDHKGAWPTYWVIGRDVKLSRELREAATDLVLGGSKKPRDGWKLRSQHVVRGHMKRQHYGPERTLLKDIWVEPYWRGPEGTEAWAHLYEADQ